MSQRERCKFFTLPGGCKKGDRCRFAHVGTPGVVSASASHPARPANPETRSGPSERLTTSPPGVCRSFWSTGQCRNAFGCRFRHITDPSLSESLAPGPTQAPARDLIAPFLTTEGVARLFEGGTDGHFSIDASRSRNPTEVHNYLKKFLWDTYRFRSAQDVYAFLELITCATSNNSSWGPEDGQLFLLAIGSGNGIRRLSDVVAWPNVSMRAGRENTVLSFQKAYLPLLRYLSSDFVVKSITSHIVNALYSVIMEHFEHFSEVVESCMTDAITVLKSLKDPNLPISLQKDMLVSQVIASLAKVLFECLTRFKNVVGTYPALHPLVHRLHEWAQSWIQAISATPPAFDDPITAETVSASAREHILNHLQQQIQQIIAMADREHNKHERGRRNLPTTHSNPNIRAEGVVAALETTYQGPGDLREEGPRHDNDFVDIAEIRIAPTHQELTTHVPPFLPANLYAAPHPHPTESMQRLLDIQFRLLREELISSLRKSVQLVLDDLHDQKGRTQLAEVLKKRGGKYRGHIVGEDTILFNLYTNVEFVGVLPDPRGVAVGINIDTPPGRARARQARTRTAFWEANGSKRLLQGGLVALVWHRGHSTNVYLGNISSSVRDHKESAQKDADRISIKVTFFDPEAELRILQEYQTPLRDRTGTKLLIEATVMYESVRPFLEALRVAPETVPFSKYLVHRPPGFFQGLKIDPPAYARMPNFKFQLSSLFPADQGITDLKLDVSNPASIATAQEELRTRSRLDPSQADAVVAALTQEVMLIQGPPGTGKSYTGVELIRVLIANAAGPVLMIAFTNHALDHMLSSVLDAGITKKVVRLGSRSADERISQFSLENIEKLAGQSRLDRSFASNYRSLKLIEEELRTLTHSFAKATVESEEIMGYIQFSYPDLHQSFSEVPHWIEVLRSLDNQDGSWKTVGRGGQEEDLDNSVYHYWKSGQDLVFLANAATVVEEDHDSGPGSQQELSNLFDVLSIADDVPPVQNEETTDSEQESSDSDSEAIPLEEEWLRPSRATNQPRNLPASGPILRQSQPADVRPPFGGIPSTLGIQPQPSPQHGIHPSDFSNLDEFFQQFGYISTPQIPSTRRSVEELLLEGDVWLMSQTERESLGTFLLNEVRVHLQETRIDEYRRLRERHADALQNYREGREEARKQLLRNVDIIGCTTTGAAKLGPLLKSIGPRVMLVEEAGQVLEVHVLANLVPSIQHLILIGDPLQLRPTINTFSLSMDNRKGRQLYKFDMSLLERLSETGMSMAQIVVQRRMRPSISNLIRQTLYPNLKDHPLVEQHPPVRGMPKNVFFLHHTHKEHGGEDDAVSKYNQFEVDMIKDLVMYLLRQGSYSSEGDIVVLCAYLGQLSRVRDALSDQVAVVIDERDQNELNDREAEQVDEGLDLTEGSRTIVEHVNVSRRVLLRTVDNFQGEEAKIVILSLVRNSGGSTGDGLPSDSPAQRANIGFLRSPNRTNVALSRAREGMYILGNRDDLASRSTMWDQVLSQLQDVDAVGTALPIACHQHPDAVEYISQPGQLPRIAPDGGCLRQCNTRLRCGHTCPYKCHPDDPNHVSIHCAQRCTRLCVRGHPCTKECAEPCGSCHTKVQRVELPCGHVAPSVECYQLDDLSEVRCNVKVTKQLPYCEHEVEMKCSDDPEVISCTKPCNGVMSCCGRNCNSSCHQCLKLNARQENHIGLVPRIQHGAHFCEKLLFCGHLCGKACSVGHECTNSCKEACRQVCVHAACKNYCSSPCSPCQEPCAWRCAHFVCPVPCGSVCARLPCDKPCENKLACGHQCPSVCGEDCNIQVCPQCAPAEAKSRVVDVILQRTLDDIEPSLGTLDELVITLPDCGHVYTVETLDGICGMEDYYICESKNGVSHWLSFKEPPVEFKNPPTCPTCRRAITSPRYGRVTKRAALDILENNVASSMSRSLDNVLKKISSSTREVLEAQIREHASRISVQSVNISTKEHKQQQKKRAAILKQTRYIPASFDAINPSRAEFYAIPTTEAKAWRKIVQSLLTAYSDTHKVATTRSSHKHAWEASFAYLYKKEMDMAAEDPLRAPREPHEYAMRMAKLRVGQPPPRADQRFVLEAFCVTISIRLTLSRLAHTWLESCRTGLSDYPSENRRMWGAYIFFVYQSCREDGRIALKLAADSESHRLKAKVTLLIMRIEFEQFQFNVQMTKLSGQFGIDKRMELASTAQKHEIQAKEQKAELEQHAYFRSRSGGQESTWLAANFSTAADAILEDWKGLTHSIRQDTFYQPVSREEMVDIVRAMGFTHTGHWYRCENGHTYAIGECGGATQQSTCPECGVAVGGNDHTLLRSNDRDTALEDIDRQLGAERSPWRWGI